MSDLGDRALGSTVDFKFTTSVNGVPTSLSGAAIEAFGSGTTAAVTSGITLTGDYGGTTGLNDVSIAATSGHGFATGEDYDVVISAGTLGGVSMVGFVVGHFSLGLGNVSNIDGNATSAQNLHNMTDAVARGTVTTGASTTSVPTSALTLAGSAASGVVADQFKGMTIRFDGNTTTAGLRGASSAISASSASNTPTLTVGTLPATPASGDTFSVI